jgi:hypothetical protein
MVGQAVHPAPIGTKVPTFVLPRRAPTTARQTVGAARPVAAPAFFETCDHDLFPTWGLDRREGHTGGAWLVAINVPPIFTRSVARVRSGIRSIRAHAEHPGGVPFPCIHHTEGGVVARMMCPSISSLLGLGARRLLRAQTCLGAVQ